MEIWEWSKDAQSVASGQCFQLALVRIGLPKEGFVISEIHVQQLDFNPSKEWMVADPRDLTIISEKDAAILRFVIGQCDKEGLSSLLRARAQLIAIQYVPGVWETRTPNSTEVRIILQDLTGPFFKMKPDRACRLLVGAIAEAGQWDKFRKDYPETAAALILANRNPERLDGGPGECSPGPNSSQRKANA